MTKTKKIFLLPLIIVFSILISLLAPVSVYANDELYKPRVSAPSASSPYYSSKLNEYFRSGSPMPNCVAYAYGRIYEMNGEAPLIKHGSAGDWYGINKKNGYYDYGKKPEVGAVACWSGHVAVVEKVSDSGITVSESHWGGKWFDTKTFDSMESHYGQKFYGYIYAFNGGVSKKLKKRLVNATKYDNSQYMTPASRVKKPDIKEVTEFGIEDTVSKSTNEIDDFIAFDRLLSAVR